MYCGESVCLGLILDVDFMLGGDFCVQYVVRTDRAVAFITCCNETMNVFKGHI